ncbi:AraC family transcriptional regulator [Spirosoma sp. RP8]|uniref:AraC family transcriptional regulator n=1 Tax=Spirosoma liriopis TaxID=2937440 RepID=A0ABT0HR19_9BACT|nr:AraC family transcriptional regulator [Spirosoma liriopis]
MFFDQGTETVEVDRQEVTVSSSQLVFGLPNQSFVHDSPNHNNQQYKFSFDEQTLALLPRAYPFLTNPKQASVISFDPLAKQRVSALLSMLFQLLHASTKPISTDIILAHLNSLLSEFNGAYFDDESRGYMPDSKRTKYVAFKLAVEKQLTEQPDVHSIAHQLGLTTSSLYALVKEYSGLSPKEWVINQLMVEAQRQLQYSPRSVKEIAYELGFNDPAYFSRLFKKKTGKTVSTFLADLRDLSNR